MKVEPQNVDIDTNSKTNTVDADDDTPYLDYLMAVDMPYPVTEIPEETIMQAHFKEDNYQITTDADPQNTNLYPQESDLTQNIDLHLGQESNEDTEPNVLPQSFNLSVEPKNSEHSNGSIIWIFIYSFLKIFLQSLKIFLEPTMKSILKLAFTYFLRY